MGVCVTFSITVGTLDTDTALTEDGLAVSTCSMHSPPGRTSQPSWGAPEEVYSLFAPALAVEREERGEDPTGPRWA
jgi:hypothetical protein